MLQVGFRSTQGLLCRLDQVGSFLCSL
jgi:hypothetical protein